MHGRIGGVPKKQDSSKCNRSVLDEKEIFNVILV